MCFGVIFIDFTYESSDTTFWLKHFLKLEYLLKLQDGNQVRSVELVASDLVLDL